MIANLWQVDTLVECFHILVIAHTKGTKKAVGENANRLNVTALAGRRKPSASGFDGSDNELRLHHQLRGRLFR